VMGKSAHPMEHVPRAAGSPVGGFERRVECNPRVQLNRSKKASRRVRTVGAGRPGTDSRGRPCSWQIRRAAFTFPTYFSHDRVLIVEQENRLRIPSRPCRTSDLLGIPAG
jgi:hypothetical protein